MVFNLCATGMRRDVQSVLGDFADALGEDATVWVPKYEHPAPIDTPPWANKPQFQDVELYFDVEVHGTDQLGGARSRVIEALKQVDPEGETIKHGNSYARELQLSSSRELDPVH
jgi:hypothetical protein